MSASVLTGSVLSMNTRELKDVLQQAHIQAAAIAHAQGEGELRIVAIAAAETARAGLELAKTVEDLQAEVRRLKAR